MEAKLSEGMRENCRMNAVRFKGDTLTIPGHGFLDWSGIGSGYRHLDESTLVVVRVVVVSMFCSIGGW